MPIKRYIRSFRVGLPKLISNSSIFFLLYNSLMIFLQHISNSFSNNFSEHKWIISIIKIKKKRKRKYFFYKIVEIYIINLLWILSPVKLLFSSYFMAFQSLSWKTYLSILNYYQINFTSNFKWKEYHFGLFLFFNISIYY